MDPITQSAPGYLLLGAALGLNAASTPGPFQAYLMAQTLKNGWRATLPASLAPLLSDGPIVAMILLVLTRAPGLLLDLIRVGGGLFLIFLAWRALQSFRRGEALGAAATSEARQQSVLEATLMNLLNPNPYLFWSAIGPLLLDAWRASPGWGLAFLAGFYLLLVGGFALFIVLFDRARALGTGVSRVLLAVSTLVLLAFGGWQFVTGVSGLLNA